MKKGIFDIEDFVAYFVYFMIIIAFIVALSLPGCQQNAAKQGITSNADSFQKLKAAQQLDVFLKTPIITPDEIKAEGILTGQSVEIPLAKRFMTENPWLYEGKTFEEFLQAIWSIKDNNADGIRDGLLKTTSTAMFSKHLPEKAMAAIFIEYPNKEQHISCLPTCAGVTPIEWLTEQEIPLPYGNKAKAKLYVKEE